MYITKQSTETTADASDASQLFLKTWRRRCFLKFQSTTLYLAPSIWISSSSRNPRRLCPFHFFCLLNTFLLVLKFLQTIWKTTHFVGLRRSDSGSQFNCYSLPFASGATWSCRVIVKSGLSQIAGVFSNHFSLIFPIKLKIHVADVTIEDLMFFCQISLYLNRSWCIFWISASLIGRPFLNKNCLQKKGNAAFCCKSFSAFVKCSKILCISTPTCFDRFPKFPILTRLFLLWFVARKGRSFGSLQGIVGWCLRGRYWRRRKNSHQWKEHRCSLRGKFYPIREWHFLKDRHSQNIWYTDTFYKRMFSVGSLCGVTSLKWKLSTIAFGEGDGMYRACECKHRLPNSGTVEGDWHWNLTARPVSNVQCAHDAPTVSGDGDSNSLKNGWRDHCRTTRRPHWWCERKGIDSSSNLTNPREEWKQKLYWKERCLNSFNIKKIFFFRNYLGDDVFGMSFPWEDPFTYREEPGLWGLVTSSVESLWNVKIKSGPTQMNNTYYSYDIMYTYIYIYICKYTYDAW